MRRVTNGSFASLAQDVVMSSWDYVSTGLKKFDNLDAEGYYISHAFLDKCTLHIAKNFMKLPKIKVPLILGIWGGKGQGKTFQCDLVYKKLGVSAIVMSAGELESGNAGEPAKLVRQRYREASDIVKKGKMASLFINDLVGTRERACWMRARAEKLTGFYIFTCTGLCTLALPPDESWDVFGYVVIKLSPMWASNLLRGAGSLSPPFLPYNRTPARVAWAAPPSTPSTTRW